MIYHMLQLLFSLLFRIIASSAPCGASDKCAMKFGTALRFNLHFFLLERDFSGKLPEKNPKNGIGLSNSSSNGGK